MLSERVASPPSPSTHEGLVYTTSPLLWKVSWVSIIYNRKETSPKYKQVQ